ncbi:hypothetical protein B9T19_07145 [Ignatzschineria sp. F8392]|uniref:hypothetical protein n=1 Tax=Ignatzschineria sp. F8392 TaxID=1980117 RepID=UPI000B99156B|nr:hypothetical protein [Ignatzschineria sp. F8392]OYQ79529.1 hypothetical protein B9T19_07145 [Ignatzschineria sp. F8392]
MQTVSKESRKKQILYRTLKSGAPILLSLLIMACSHTPKSLPSHQPYLDAQRQIQSLTTDQYQILPDQSIYIGELKSETATGYGKIIMPDGSHYQGAVKNGRPHGFGRSEMSSGEIYEGEHKNGIFEGRGRLILSDGSTFIGTFKDHKVDRGEIFFPDGTHGVSR